MALPFSFATNFAARLTADFGSGATSFTLSSVPADLPAGRYPFKLGTDQRSAEWLAATYPGSGTTFTDAERHSEGGNPPRSWSAGMAVACVLTGEAFESLRNTTAAPTPVFHPELYARSAAARLYLSDNFT